MHGFKEHHIRILLLRKDKDLLRDLLEMLAKENIPARELADIAGRL